MTLPSGILDSDGRWEYTGAMWTPKSEAAIRIVKSLIVAFSLISVALFFYQSIRNHNYIGGNDLTSYLNSSRWFFDGENPYTATVRRYMYPLFLLVVTYPLTFLQSNYAARAATAAIWSALSYFAFFITVFSSWRYLDRRPWNLTTLRTSLFPLCLLILLLHPFLQDEFLNGQVNLFVLGTTAAYFFMLQRKRPSWAALFLAASVSLKIAPGLCLLLVVFTRQYRTIAYTALIVALFTVALPYWINSQSLAYYKYFAANVAPLVTGSDFEGGFKSFSVISTVSFMFGIHWYPPLKIAAVGLLAAALFAPVRYCAGKRFAGADYYLRFSTFAAIVSIIPLTFPMSESHHLLILTIPFLAILAYWRQVLKDRKVFLKDRLSVWFAVSLAVLHIGHGLKPTPLRLIGLIGIYAGMVMLLRRLSSSTAGATLQR